MVRDLFILILIAAAVWLLLDQIYGKKRITQFIGQVMGS